MVGLPPPEEVPPVVVPLPATELPPVVGSPPTADPPIAPEPPVLPDSPESDAEQLDPRRPAMRVRVMNASLRISMSSSPGLVNGPVR